MQSDGVYVWRLMLPCDWQAADSMELVGRCLSSLCFMASASGINKRMLAKMLLLEYEMCCWPFNHQTPIVWKINPIWPSNIQEYTTSLQQRGALQIIIITSHIIHIYYNVESSTISLLIPKSHRTNHGAVLSGAGHEDRIALMTRSA